MGWGGIVSWKLDNRGRVTSVVKYARTPERGAFPARIATLADSYPSIGGWAAFSLGRGSLVDDVRPYTELRRIRIVSLVSPSPDADRPLRLLCISPSRFSLYLPIVSGMMILSRNTAGVMDPASSQIREPLSHSGIRSPLAMRFCGRNIDGVPRDSDASLRDRYGFLVDAFLWIIWTSGRFEAGLSTSLRNDATLTESYTSKPRTRHTS